MTVAGLERVSSNSCDGAYATHLLVGVVSKQGRPGRRVDEWHVCTGTKTYVCKEYMNQGALPGALAMQERRGNSQLNVTSISAGTCKAGSQRTCRLSAAGIAYVPSGKTRSPVSLMNGALSVRENECNTYCMNHRRRCKCTLDLSVYSPPYTWAPFIVLRLGLSMPQVIYLPTCCSPMYYLQTYQDIYIQPASSQQNVHCFPSPAKSNPSRLAQRTCSLSSLPGPRKTTPKYDPALPDGRIGLRDAVPRSVSAPIPAVAGAESPYGRHISSLLLRISPVVCCPDMRRA